MILPWTALGGFLGLVTFVFAVWDRFVRNRPLAWFIALPRTFDQVFPYVRVKNPGQTHILITDVSCDNPGYFVAESETIGGIVRALSGDAALALLGPGDEKDFPLSRSATEELPSGRIHVMVSWRDATWTWLPQPKKRAWTTVGDIDRMVKAAERAAKAGRDD